MKIIAKILQSVLVNHFYKLNAGFFIFLLFALFGVVRGEQLIQFHLGLIQAVLTGPIFLCLIILIWAFYTIKCINYISKRLMEPGLRFLTTMNHLPRKQVWYWMALVHFQVYFPVIAYVAAILVVAIKAHQYLQAGLILVANLLFFIGAVQVYFKTLQQQNPPAVLFRMPVIKWPFAIPTGLFSFVYLWKERRLMLLLTKLFTLVYLYGFLQFYEPYHYDIRPILLGFLLMIAAHGSLIFQVRSFENDYLLFTRNLPISIVKRFLQVMGLYLFLMLPELLFVWKGYPLHFSVIDYWQVLLMVLAIPSFLHAILYTSIMDGDEFLKISFAFLTLLFFLILYDPGFLLFVFVGILAFVFFSFHFYGYEKPNQVKNS